MAPFGYSLIYAKVGPEKLATNIVWGDVRVRKIKALHFFNGGSL